MLSAGFPVEESSGVLGDALADDLTVIVVTEIGFRTGNDRRLLLRACDRAKMQVYFRGYFSERYSLKVAA